MSLLFTRLPSPLGELLLTEEKGALTGLYLFAQKYYPTLPGSAREENTALFALTGSLLQRYFAGENPDFSCLPLAPAGTPFRQRVWSALRDIPYGATVSYGELAKALHSSPRAVGGAVGHNPISILIPCHRVVAADGALQGYAGGVKRKRFLLTLEQTTV
ncbi:MAG: methylated-DNA--[protein]-cysteine S-methyltransferase [Clostridiales bacterium]|nr:methylated-DNA--[protein]-cysteine S-methyltransferase [Candidatus Apopatocola equi]